MKPNPRDTLGLLPQPKRPVFLSALRSIIEHHMDKAGVPRNKAVALVISDYDMVAASDDDVMQALIAIGEKDLMK